MVQTSNYSLRSFDIYTMILKPPIHSPFGRPHFSSRQVVTPSDTSQADEALVVGHWPVFTEWKTDFTESHPTLHYF